MSFSDSDRFLRRVDPRNQLKKQSDPQTGKPIWVLTTALFKYPRPIPIGNGLVRSSIDQGTGDETVGRAMQRLRLTFPAAGIAAFSYEDAMGIGMVEAIEPEPLEANVDHCRLDHADTSEAYVALARICWMLIEPGMTDPV